MPVQTPVNVFFCYAPEDEGLREELERHLALLQREGDVRSWSSRRIGAGEDWRVESRRRMDRADVILFLVSADFLASDHLYDLELGRALSRGRSEVVGVLLRPCDWKQGALKDLLMLPVPPGKAEPLPVTAWSSTDEALACVAAWLREKAARLGKGAVAPSDRPSTFAIEGRITKNPSEAHPLQAPPG
jgi:hypothetical protein